MRNHSAPRSLSWFKRSFPVVVTLAMIRPTPGELHAEQASSHVVQVAALQVKPKRWDKAQNFALLDCYARRAAAQGAQLIVTCEGFLDGYTGNPDHAPELTETKYRQIGEPIDGPWIAKIRRLAIELELFLSVGFAERRGDQMFNSTIVMSPTGEVVLHYSKSHTRGEPFNTPGDRFPIAHTKIGTLGSLICYDRFFPEVARILAVKGANVLIIPAYGNDGEMNEVLLRTRAWENSTWIVYVRQNQAFVINPQGTVVGETRGPQDQMLLTEIDLGSDSGAGQLRPRRDPQTYREIITAND